MKSQKIIAVSVALLWFAVGPAFAQHPHGGARADGSHGPAMGSNAGGHGSSDASTKGTESSPTTLLTKNTKLDSNLTSKLQAKGLLPAGTDLKDACAGFKNLGQCVAAIHVSHNLDVPFACLKANMTGAAPATGSACPARTGAGKMSLGKSIQTLSPNADAKAASKTGTSEANADIKDAETAS